MTMLEKQLTTSAPPLPGSTPAIAVSNLVKNFGAVRAVDQVEFAVAPGEVLGILGPNGAGKTTTIRMITGILGLAPGAKVSIQGRNFRQAPNWCKTQFGIVPEVSNAFMDFTVFQNLEFSGRIYGLSKTQIRKRGQILLEEFDLASKRDAVTKTLSKGLKQRLSFCRALLHDPPILIFDEPTSGLDPLSIRLLRDRTARLKERGKTILLTTHDLREAEKLCDRVLIMVRGRIIADETPTILRQKYGADKQVLFKPVTPLSPPALNTLFSTLTGKKFTGPDQGGYFRFYTKNALNDLATLKKYCDEIETPVADLKLEESTLEDAFIHLVMREEDDRE